MQAALRPIIALVLVAVAGGAQAQALDELIRMRVERLADTGELEAHGVAVAAKNLIPAIYQAHGFAPEWHSADQVQGLLEVIEDSYLEGLDPADYNVDAVRDAHAAYADMDALTPEARADYDLVLTDSVVRLGYHLRFGKVDPVALNPDWNFSRELEDRDAVETIQAAIDAPSMRAFADDVLPRSMLYTRLKDALARYRAIAAKGGWPVVPAGPTLKPGLEDPRVPAIARRLIASGDLEQSALDASSLAYGEPLAAAVRRFQARHGLTADGVIGATTQAALAVPVDERIETLRVNLERARWVFNELNGDFVSVNIAAFRLDLVRGGEREWSTRVVVGQPYRRTPVFKSTMRYLVFNPTWTIPSTVFLKDVLPELRRDPGYLAARNIDVFDATNGAPVDPATIDWVGRRNFPFRLVQRPGPSNALGRVKFMFPNTQFVYLHDTPSRDLFSRSSRAFSSGCIRVEQPLELARRLLGPKWTLPQIEAAIATGDTKTVFLDMPITVMLLYATAEVDDGQVHFWPDIYERDHAVAAGLAAPFKASATL